MQKWFKAKTYGWGWQPATWHGWVLTLIFLVYLIWLVYSSFVNPGTGGTSSFYMRFVSAIVIFVVIAALTGEKPRWQWGDKSKNTTPPTPKV